MRALVGAATAMEAMETVAPGWVAVETVTRRVASGMQKAEATARRRAVGKGRRMGAVATGRCAEAARAVVGAKVMPRVVASAAAAAARVRVVAERARVVVVRASVRAEAAKAAVVVMATVESARQTAGEALVLATAAVTRAVVVATRVTVVATRVMVVALGRPTEAVWARGVAAQVRMRGVGREERHTQARIHYSPSIRT